MIISIKKPVLFNNYAVRGCVSTDLTLIGAFFISGPVIPLFKSLVLMQPFKG
jgi:hypothetical protein